MHLTRDEILKIGNALNAEAARFDKDATRLGVVWYHPLRIGAQENRALSKRLVESIVTP